MSKYISGFGNAAFLPTMHVNANFDGSDQDFPYPPIETTVAAPSGFQAAWGSGSNVVITMGGR